MLATGVTLFDPSLNWSIRPQLELVVLNTDTPTDDRASYHLGLSRALADEEQVVRVREVCESHRAISAQIRDMRPSVSRKNVGKLTP